MSNIVQMEPDLYRRVVAALPEGPVRGEVVALTEDDWCDDDGDRYCSNHDQTIAYWVTNFGPEGKVITGSISQSATAFPVCPGAWRYNPGLDQ